jgi:hypothetical protein
MMCSFSPSPRLRNGDINLMSQMLAIPAVAAAYREWSASQPQGNDDATQWRAGLAPEHAFDELSEPEASVTLSVQPDQFWGADGSSRRISPKARMASLRACSRSVTSTLHPAALLTSMGALAASAELSESTARIVGSKP